MFNRRDTEAQAGVARVNLSHSQETLGPSASPKFAAFGLLAVQKRKTGESSRERLSKKEIGGRWEAWCKISWVRP